MSEKNYKNSSVMWYSTKVIRDSREYNQNNLMLTNSTYLSNVKACRQQHRRKYER